ITYLSDTGCLEIQGASLAVWLVAAYLPGVAPGFTGFPRWFEMACILTPLLFIGLCWAMVKFIYRDIPLEDDDAA
ncbi:YhdT family protein, partial [Escherichia coli]|nr:YhdT family protein [Escherichia coli]